MIKIALISCLNILFMTAFGQNTTVDQNKDAVNWMPYLTKNKDYIFVDKNLKKQIDASYAQTNKFSETGYALVTDTAGKNAVIDTKGKIIVDYNDHNIGLKIVNNLTLMSKSIEYEKKMPIWKWDWNIMGGGIKKMQTYKKIEISVIETNQLLFEQDVPYLDHQYYLNAYSLDDQHVVMNDVLFEIKDNKFKKLKNKIAMSLENGRYIPENKNTFDIFSIKDKKPILSNLKDTEKIYLTVNNQPFILDSINQDRYIPTVPKTLQDSKTNEIYVYPQYDKVFPKEIKNATAEQINFLENVSLVYSVNNSPYFILGRFNYNHDAWAFDWLYVDKSGNLLNEIKVKNFYILDQIGRVVWPDKYMILSKAELNKKYKIDEIKYIYQSDNLFIVNTKVEGENSKDGLWNSDTKSWEIEPLYHAIQMLNSRDGIYALQKEENGSYILYNHKTKHQMGTKAYESIHRTGLVSSLNDDKQKIYFYIDLLTGKEYKENNMAENDIIINKGLQYAKQKIEEHYEDKFTYALPDWAMSTGNPEIVAIIHLHGVEGIAITNQMVDFKVDFRDKLSVIYYAEFLNNQMNKHLETIGYILFYDKNIYLKKDPNYSKNLTDDQKSELLKSNSNRSTTDISILKLNKSLDITDNFE